MWEHWIKTLHKYKQRAGYYNTRLQNICMEIEAHADKRESRDLHQKIRSITKSQFIRSWAIENSQGLTVTEIEQVRETWKNNCQSLFEDPHSRCFESTEPIDEEKEANILKDEVSTAVKHLKKGKATGSDSIPIETIKASGEYCVQIFHALCNRIWQIRTWPQEWTHTIFVPLHKKGSSKSCSNYLSPYCAYFTCKQNLTAHIKRATEVFFV